MKSNRKLLTFALVALLAVALSEAGPRLEAPSKYMKQDRYNSAVVRVTEVTENGRFKLEVIENLYGETADGLIVRASGGGDGWIEAGKVYIIGHTDKPARRTYRYDVDPEGSRILGVPAVGHAVLANTESMRTLVRQHPEDAPLTDEKRLEAVLEQLGDEDVLSRRFVTAELALDPELRALVDKKQLALLKETVASGVLEPVAHEYLLRAAHPMIDSWGSEWLAEDTRAIVSSHGAELDLVSPIPSLLVTAFKTLQVTGKRADAELARPHVASNNPGVGKAAFSAMVALDEGLAKKAAPELLSREDLHGDIRRVVASFWARVEASTGTR